MYLFGFFCLLLMYLFGLLFSSKPKFFRKHSSYEDLSLLQGLNLFFWDNKSFSVEEENFSLSNFQNWAFRQCRFNCHRQLVLFHLAYTADDNS